MKCASCNHLFPLEPAAPGMSLAGAALGLLVLLLGVGLINHSLTASLVIMAIGGVMLPWALYQVAATMKAVHPACPKCGTALRVRPWSL